MNDLVPEPLSAQAFAPYGLVFQHGQNAVGERAEYRRFMRSDRPSADLGFAIARKAPSELPLPVRWLECHPHSSQAFVSIDLPAFLVMVCPTDAHGGPEVAGLRAFIGSPTQGVCYSPDVWHHPFVVLDGAGEYLTLRYDDGSARDTLWHEVVDGPRVIRSSGG